MASRRTALKSLAHYSAAIYASQALLVLRGGVLAALLSPLGFGLWRMVKLALDYAVHLPMGTVHALRQELPLAIGRNDIARARRVTGATLGFILFIGASLVILGIAGSLAAPRFWPQIPVWLFLITPLLITGLLLLLFADGKLLSEERTGRSSGATFALAVLSVTSMVPAAKWAGLPGALGALLFSQSCVILWLVCQREFPRPLFPRRETLQPLWRIGLPIWATWIPVTLLGDVDQWLVATQLGPTMLGYYGIAVFFGSLLMFLPFIFRSVFLPILLRLNAKTATKTPLQEPFKQALHLIGYAAPIPIALVYFASQPLIDTFLPAYRSALPATRWYCLGTFWWIVASATHLFCLVAQTKRRWFIQTLSAIAAHVLITSAVIRAGGGLEGVALSMAGIMALYALAQVHAVVVILEMPWKEWASILLRLLVPFVLLCALCLGLSQALPSTGASLARNALSASANMLVTCVILSGLFYAANRKLLFTQLLHT